jgi:uncharacterized membrane protein YgcG
MITCQYCRRHMTEVELTCPHCGRSRDDGETDDVPISFLTGAAIVEDSNDDSSSTPPDAPTDPEPDVSGGGGDGGGGGASGDF